MTALTSHLRLTAAVLTVVLAACRKEVPPPPVPPAEPTPRVSAGAEARGASDHPQAAPAIGAMTAGQAAGGRSDRAMQPSGGDGRPAASAPAPRASPP
ncbi:hypothetical protein J2X20_001232 [Pelomonas saccharophila]|uniref:Lipoprotein n=1 Tax=Roseateles saccharophilus TaxID=304 RepID=A0ABU1YIR2_ROSSA|nr:hypothetical protein [Roseateles saccharophilus]MDR7268603.1 hypothetical protein [Roseateles saccharophilus]